MIDLLGIDRKDRGEASCEEHSGKGYDEGLDLKITDKKTLNDTECKSDSECKQGSSYCVSALVQVQNAAHYRKGCYRTDTDVDAAAYHDDRKTEGYDDKAGIVIQHVKYLLRAKETAAEENHREHIHAEEDAYCDGHQELCIRKGLSEFLCFHASAAPFESLFIFLAFIFLTTLSNFFLTTGEPMTTRRMMTPAL